jgi:hypothetical protein
MPTISEATEYLVSGLPDGHALSLDCADGIEYANLMRRIGLVEGEGGTPVSAFNSSI